MEATSTNGKIDLGIGGKVESTSAGVEFVLFDAEALLQGDVKITERHVLTSAFACVDMALVLESASSDQDRKIAIRVSASITHTTSKENDGMIEHRSIRIGLFDLIQSFH